jgi:hypothetical protein
MTTTNDHHKSGPVSQPARRLPSLGLARPPSFAWALRQRGLLVRPEVNAAVSLAAAEPPDQWQAVVSLFEAHLRRQAMEQAFSALRDDAA